MTTDERCVGEPISDTGEMLSRVAARQKNKETGPSIATFHPSKSTFVPGQEDNGGLSTKRPSQAPEAAYKEFVAGKAEREAIGVYGVTVGEYKHAGQLAGHELPVHDDGEIGSNPAHHASVWYPVAAELTKSAKRTLYERIAKNVLEYAKRDGRCLFRPESP